MTDALFLTSDEVADLATPAAFVAAVREGYRERGMGAAAQPRSRFSRSDPDGTLMGYAAVLPETGAMGSLTYSVGFGAEDAWFMLSLFDADSGEPLALLDGASMNPFKTGAAGAVGVDALARDDADTLAIIGTGPQARGQLRTTATVREFTDVRVYSPTPAHRESFAADFDEELAATVRAVDSSEAAVSDADVVITATRSNEPVFDGTHLNPGTHITAMGQNSPETRELDTTTIERATYVPDLEARVDTAGEFVLAREEGAVTDDDVHAELGEVVAGVAPGRTSDEEITVFDSGGTGIETVAAGYMLYENAREAGRGTELEFSPSSAALTGEVDDD
ncbi:ornithine cyclodeaminase family protein [Natrialbaceae archaeon A-arb3/5]